MMQHIANSCKGLKNTGMLRKIIQGANLEWEMIRTSRSVSNWVGLPSDPPKGALLDRYADMVKQGVLRPDQHQRDCVVKLSSLCDDLSVYSRVVDEYEQNLARYEAERQKRRLEIVQKEEEALMRKKEAKGHDADDKVPGWIARCWDSISGSRQQLSEEQQAYVSASNREDLLDRLCGLPPTKPAAPRGIYIFGSVGSGKSLLMDMFYSTVSQQNNLPRMRRMHFNSAMLEVHSRLHKLELERRSQSQEAMDHYASQMARYSIQDKKIASNSAANLSSLYCNQSGDPFKQKQREARAARLAARRGVRQRLSRSPSANSEVLARSNAVILSRAAQSLIRGRDGGGVSLGWESQLQGRAAGLLCFDELQITDVFSAAALKGVMEALLDEGCVIVATSNRAPWELPRHGLHEDMFSHFVDVLLNCCEPLELSAKEDYRRLLTGFSSQAARGGAALPCYLHPISPETDAGLEVIWNEITADSSSASPISLPVMFGRTLQVDKSKGGVAWFTFEELCARRLGAADYIALAESFHTVFLSHIPALSMQVRDQARRFITLIDELYNAKVRLICTAAVPPDELLAGGMEGEHLIDLESLQFEGAVEGSRLRRDLSKDGGVAPIASTTASAKAAQDTLGGMEEQFAFKRAISRLHEMQSPPYLQSRLRS